MDFNRAKTADRLLLIHMQDTTQGAGRRRGRKVPMVLIVVASYVAGVITTVALMLNH